MFKNQKPYFPGLESWSSNPQSSFLNWHDPALKVYSLYTRYSGSIKIFRDSKNPEREYQYDAETTLRQVTGDQFTSA